MKRPDIVLLLAGITLFLAGFVLLLVSSLLDNEALSSLGQFTFLLGFCLLFLNGYVALFRFCRKSRFGPWHYAVMLLGVLLGFLTWRLSEPLTGVREPWDAPGFYYLIALLLSGMICGLLAPRSWFASCAGILTGQLAASQFGLGMFGPLGTVALFVCIIPALVASVAGAGIVVGSRRILRLGGRLNET